MVFTTTVVNTHALSHLFDNDFSSVEHCNTCDDYVLSTQDHIFIISPDLDVFKIKIVEISVKSAITFSKNIPSPTYHKGKYYNKPPPLLS